MSKHIITIDGPAASGKGTLSKALAKHLDYAWLDTGLLYRATGIYTKKRGKDPELPQDAAEVASTLEVAALMTDPDLRTAEAGRLASVVAAFPEVRAALLSFQREFAASPPEEKVGAVLDGRDTGTIICPDAPVKIFVTADVEERARRRHKELKAKGHSAEYDDILADLKARDHRDTHRSVAPLKPAVDAIIVDTTHLTIEESIAAVLQAAEERLQRIHKPSSPEEESKSQLQAQ